MPSVKTTQDDYSKVTKMLGSYNFVLTFKYKHHVEFSNDSNLLSKFPGENFFIVSFGQSIIDSQFVLGVFDNSSNRLYILGYDNVVLSSITIAPPSERVSAEKARDALVKDHRHVLDMVTLIEAADALSFCYAV